MKKSEELLRFENDLKADSELEKKLHDGLEEAVKTGAGKSKDELLSEAARSLGYEISAGELERARAGAEELDLDELEQIAGGGYCALLWTTEAQDEHGHNIWCYTLWHCEVVTMHTETNSKSVCCWSDYRCETNDKEGNRVSSS